MVIDTAISLGSLTDVWVLIMLIIPGFITFRLLLWAAVYKNKFDQFTTIIYSLICSLIVFLPIAYLHELESLQHMSTQIIEPTVILQMMGFSSLFGIVPGFILKYTIRNHYRRGSAWDEFASEFALVKDTHHYVTIYTKDNKEYIGWIKRMSIGKEEKRDIVLADPQFVKRMSGVTPELKNMGYELLFPEDSIKRILKT